MTSSIIFFAFFFRNCCSYNYCAIAHASLMSYDVFSFHYASVFLLCFLANLKKLRTEAVVRNGGGKEVEESCLFEIEMCSRVTAQTLKYDDRGIPV